jgi:hypothetical protein
MDPIALPRGLRCPYCHADVEPARPDWIACAACLARHHAACWRDECASCRGRRALRPPRVRRSILRIEAWAWTPWLVALSLLIVWRADARTLPQIPREPEVGLVVRFEPPPPYVEQTRCGPRRPADRHPDLLIEVDEAPRSGRASWGRERGSCGGRVDMCGLRVDRDERAAAVEATPGRGHETRLACCALARRRDADTPSWQHAARFRAARDLIALARHAEALALLRENIAESPDAVDVDEAHGWAAVCEAAVGDVQMAFEHTRKLGGGRRWDERRADIRRFVLRRCGVGHQELECNAVREVDRSAAAARAALLTATRDLVRDWPHDSEHLRDPDHLDALAELVETGALRLSGER